MMLTPPRHIRLAVLGNNVVAFDVRHDRYIALPGAVASCRCSGRPLWDAIDASLEPEAAELLIGEGLLVEGGSAPNAISRPVASLERSTGVIPTALDITRLIIALSSIGLRLLRGRHCRRFDAERLPPIAGAELAEYAAAVSHLAALRLAIPTPCRCLPAALVAARFLQSQDLLTEIVFGVRGHPFEAHCWLERGGIVLDDDLDRVRGYTPIAVGRL